MEFKVLKAQASRRDVIKGALKGAAYAAPVVAASSLPMLAGAATGPFGQSLFVNGVNSTTVAIGSTLVFTGRGYTPNEQLFIRFFAAATAASATITINATASGNINVTVNTVGFPTSTTITATVYRQDPRFIPTATPLVSVSFVLTGGSAGATSTSFPNPIIFTSEA